ncbi:spore germination protein [Bacillus sp. FJAT-44742]|uniref:spore germination protein n=1 Tax=Bacillus sp. FJAT-44742 TaxID=2014005 RepID=UPI000C24E156|nr:spore germination protein [Bacillus sp. FJAT-44742]
MKTLLQRRKFLRNQLKETTPKPKNDLDLCFSGDLKKDSSFIKEAIGSSEEINQRYFGVAGKRKACLFFLEGLADEQLIDRDILRPLMEMDETLLEKYNETGLLTEISSHILPVSSVEAEGQLDSLLDKFFSGHTVLIIDGCKQALTIEAISFTERSVEQPETEVVVRGPRDGFTENIETNVMLLRRRLKDPNLTFEYEKVGERSKTRLSIGYIKGLADENVVEEIRYRIQCIEFDNIQELGMVEEFIKDNQLSIFPTSLYTERPDKAASFLSSGHVALLLDGTPYAMIQPILFPHFFKSPEDYYENWIISTLIRTLRTGAVFIAVFLPALYIALVSFHQGMIPTTLALSIAASREGVPFPSFMEAIVMEITLELLREAGIRLPRMVGQTIGIVGGIVIGDAAVRAGIVSPIMIIVVALTAIASFTLPVYNISIAIRILRFAFMISAAFLGLYGIIIVLIIVFIHLSSLKSFGSHYLSPFSPFRFLEWGDMMLRLPLSNFRQRNKEPAIKDKVRQKT